MMSAGSITPAARPDISAPLANGLSFCIHGAPRTKKNSGIITTRGKHPRILPSAAFSAWNRIAQLQFNAIREHMGGLLPITCKVNAHALFYRDRDTGDAVGYYQALADAMEEGKILVNDRQVVSWDGSRLLKDAAKPRIEVWIQEAL